MPRTIRFEPEPRVCVVTISGEVQGRDLAAALEELVANPRSATHPDVLWVLTGITGLDVVPEDVGPILEMQRELEAHIGPGRGAFVSTHPDVVALMGLVRHRRSDSRRELRVFPTEAQARRWLNGHSPTPDP